MKIPSPGPLDDRGVLCEDKYRILLNYVKGAFFLFLYRLYAVKKRDLLSQISFYTPKRFRTAVAGMKIPSPGPLDDRGVLCAPNIDVSRKLSRVFV